MGSVSTKNHYIMKQVINSSNSEGKEPPSSEGPNRQEVWLQHLIQ